MAAINELSPVVGTQAARMVKKLVEYCNTRGVWTEFPLPSVGSPSTGIDNLRPEQELNKHSEHPRDHDQLPSA